MGFSSSTAQSVMSRFFNNLWKKCAPYSSDHRRKPTDTDRDEAKWAFPEELCRRFSLAEIIAVTQNFNARLRICSTRNLSFEVNGLIEKFLVFDHLEGPKTEDGINVSAAGVYKGYTNLNGVTSTVAIKRIPSTQSDIQQGREFKAEVQLLCQLRHPNLISLIGFCQEKGECAIVYNHMSNGPLSYFLFNPHNNNKDPLSWSQRLNICIGVARAIHYLHTGVKHAVIHRDIKCDNILLDQSLEAKLCNFRLSKMGPPTLSNALIRLNSVSGVAGTFGYLDPEYDLSGQLTEKSDVFSFGMVLFEVLSAKYSREIPQLCIAHPADILDSFLMGKVAPDSLIKFLDIFQRCVRPTGSQRPTMGEVEVELECALELQESADAEKELRTPSTSLGCPADDYAYHYQGISLSEINDVFCFLCNRPRTPRHPVVISTGSADLDSISTDLSVLSDDDGSSEFEYSGR
ncbi:receptor-like protein kinase ANXUR2 [Pyrus x bretschneideri]|uniref:receptor-like protein kinase ANXUR2 n=1 Tax=Pyrus x bretschneideri TaxID=225117 RepID=UPI00202E78B9|nr:receptor-like protein kinase ANXUR2 [Pyrus x bretschneideri]